MTVSNNPVPSNFDVLPPASMGQESDAAAFKTTGDDGTVYGNLVFADTIADAEHPGDSITIIREYQLPLAPGESLKQFQERVLKDLKSDDPQIVPDALLMDAANSGAITNIDMASLAEAQMMFGAPFVKECLSQGKDPGTAAAKIVAAMAKANTQTADLSDQERQELFLALVIAEGNENGPATPPSNPAIKTIFSKVLEEIKFEDSQEEANEPSSENPPIAPQPSTMEDVRKIYGDDFVKEALSEGKDPIKFIAEANQAMSQIVTNPPLTKLSHSDMVHLLFQLLLVSTNQNNLISPQKVLALGDPGKIQTILSQILAQMKANTTTPPAVVQTSTASNVAVVGNPWLAATPLVAFMTCFLDVVRQLMKLKQVEGKIELTMMAVTMSMAKILAKTEKKLADLAQKTAIMGIVGGAACIGMAAGAARMSSKMSSQEKPMPTEPQYVGKSGGAASDDINALNKGNEPLGAEAKAVSDSRKTVQTKRAEEMDATRQEQLAQAKVDQERATGPVSPENTSNLQAAKAKTAKSRQERLQAEDNLTKAEDNAGIRKQTQKEFEQSVHETKLHNKEFADKHSGFIAMGQSAAQTSALLTNSMALYTTEAEGQLKAQQHIIQGLQQIIQTSLSKATSMFSTNSDNISSFLAALKDLEQAVARAQSELMK